MDLIDGVKIKKLNTIRDSRGHLMEMFRSDWPEFQKFGQAYVTVCNPGYAKAWHYHKKQTDNFICIKNTARVVLYDDRKNSKTKGKINEFVIGEKNPLLLQIPPLVRHGFRAQGKQKAYIVNIPDVLYNYKKPDEFRLPFNDKSIPYDWKVKKGG